MSRDQSLFATSLRSIIAAAGLGVLLAVTLVSLALQHNPQEVFASADGVRWLRLVPLAGIGFVLGGVGSLSAYFVWNLVRHVAGRGAGPHQSD